MMNDVFAHKRLLIEHLHNLDHEEWGNACEILLQAYKSRSTVWVGGNGGNAANAFHFATDWNKGLFKLTGKALRSHTLWENPALVSALSNDQEFELVFADQLSIFAKPGEVAVLMSGGGDSANIVRSAIKAKELGLTVIGLTGGRGQKIKHLFDVHIHIASDDIQIVEDIHASFGHTVYKFIANAQN